MKIILKNAKIYVEKNNFQEAMLIENGIIKKVGTNNCILENEAENIIDLQGKTVIPGLNDSHLHLALSGEAMTSCDLTSAKSINEAIESGRKFLQSNKDITAIFGRGWNQDYFISGEARMFNRHDLDRVSTDIPVIYERVCGHVSVGNTKALNILGIDETTHVDGGEILKGTDGKPNGIFTENAMGLLQSVLPVKSDDDMEKEFLKAADYAVSVGITSVQSCDSIGKGYKKTFDIIQKIYDNNKTKLKYSSQFNFQNINDFKNYLKTEHGTESHYEKYLKNGALKLFKDGSLGARTALMLKEYNDEPGTMGVSVLSDEDLRSFCSLAAENGIRIVTHAIGDGAIESVINAYESTMKDGRNPLRHGIVHCQISRPEQLKRIAELGIPVMYQPIFLDYDIQIVESRVGKELASTSYAFNTLKELDTPISFGTDSPVEDMNPFPNIYCAVTRQRINGTPAGGFVPSEKMSVEDAIDAYTMGSAFNEFKENEKGRLKPGYAADLAVLDNDIFTIDSGAIKGIKVEKTMIDGEFIYEKK